MDVKLSECRYAYDCMSRTGVYRIFLTSKDTLLVCGDGTKGNGTEKASIRVDAADFEEMDKRSVAREIQRRFAGLESY